MNKTMDTIKEKLHNRIKRSCGKAIGDFNLIKDGDRIAVAVSITLICLIELLIFFSKAGK